MSTNEAGLSPAGTSSYDSNTMHVGDGTWDASRDSFLLPNLQGLNFATMQYNGMGNRFRGLQEYHVLITGHGVIAAITFLGIVPAAIFIARFLHSEGRLAYKLHVYLQILTVLLATVVITLGAFAVGPERALTNPHHGIGIAIYVCVVVQFLFGWWMSRRERKRERPHPTIPLKVHLHRLFGRAIALLAFAQIALGLTLYGSPKVLFILYALWGAFLLFWYLTLEYRNKARLVHGLRPAPSSEYYSDYSGSYLSGSRSNITQDRRRRDHRSSGHWGEKLLAGAGLFGAYEWYKRKRDKRQDEKEERYDERHDERYEERMRRERPPSTPGPLSTLGPPPSGPYGPGYGPSSRPPGPPESVPPPASYAPRPQSRSSYRARRHDETVMSPQSWEQESEDEKYEDGRQRESHTWRNRLLGAGAGIAGFEGIKSLFGRKRRNDGYVDSDISYRPPPGASEMTQTDVSRVEAGQAPFSPQTDPRNRRRVRMADDPVETPTKPSSRRRASVSSLSYDDEESTVPPRRSDGEGHTLRDSIATLGAVAGFREWNKRRKERKEQERADRIHQQEIEDEEQFNRRNSDRYPRPQDASGRRPSNSDTLMTGPSAVDPVRGSNPELSRQQFRPDTSLPPLPAAAGTIPGGYSQQSVPTQQMSQQQTQNTTFNLPPPPPGPPPHATRPTNYQSTEYNTASMPEGAVNPDPSRLISEQHQSQASDGRYQDGTAAAATEAAAAAAGVAASQRTQSQSPTRRRGSRTRFSSGRRSSSAGASNSNGIGQTGSPPVAVKVTPHADGRHVTLRRLNEEEAAAERAARRRERRSRRPSSLSSGGEEASGSRSRFRRNVPVRDSSQQPITNVPVPPPALSNSAIGSNRRNSEVNMPTVPPPPAGRVPLASDSATPPGLLPAVGPAGSGTVGSPGAAGTDMGTGTDVSAFDSNRRRRRAERARRAEAARGGNRVEFE